MRKLISWENFFKSLLIFFFSVLDIFFLADTRGSLKFIKSQCCDLAPFETSVISSEHSRETSSFSHGMSSTEQMRTPIYMNRYFSAGDNICKLPESFLSQLADCGSAAFQFLQCHRHTSVDDIYFFFGERESMRESVESGKLRWSSSSCVRFPWHLWRKILEWMNLFFFSLRVLVVPLHHNVLNEFFFIC